MITWKTACLMLVCLIAGCGGGGGDSVDPADDEPVDGGEGDEQFVARADVRDTDQLYAYRTDSPYASVLRDCALVDRSSDACTLEVLPFITQATPDFTREDILDRLLVTHDWMGQRFEQLLTEAPEDMVTLFGALTSIAIGSTVRPSNYWGGTGGIQLDPEYLWLTVDEKATVSIEEDYRSGYGKDLRFWAFGTLRLGNEPASLSYSLTNSTERTLDDIRIPVYRLLYHELAHAVDYLPSSSVATLDASLTPSAALDANRQYWLSPGLYLDLPLYSEELQALAQVSYKGEESTAEQRGYSPAHVGSLMANDGAAKYYGYSTHREDFATLFATTMIKRDFGVDYYMAFVQKPEDEENYECSDLSVGWGVRNRIADPLVQPRAKWVMESIYGFSNDIDTLFAGELGQQTLMTEGLDWCSNRDGLSSTAAKRRMAGEDAGITEQARIQLEAERVDNVHGHHAE
ncbi:hypothetical protein ACUNV4_25915 [Granulosicoccus sp. 3-233]|uniref:hypothetical protein n=1 Tax=Granulosicoccus sp. 3-233 TaxID=3417969 RepID=UPI003D349783